MKFYIAAVVVAGIFCYASAEPVCFCPMNFAPVCGTDGKTYGNMCELNCKKRDTPEAGLRMDYRGRCYGDEHPHHKHNGCVCPKTLEPVCGSDKRTYPNKCSLDCYKKDDQTLTQASEGRCHGHEVNHERHHPCFCPYNLALVCGSDGKTYANWCELACAQSENEDLAKVKDGSCDDDGEPRDLWHLW